jgi:hypothetical protein
MMAGSVLQVGDSAATNTGNVLINGTLAVDVSTLTFSGAGTVTLAGATIEGSATGETLVNDGETISGTGTIGDGSGNLALDNAGGTIQAAGGTLVLDTGTTITNAGTLNATSGATLRIDDPITGTGSATIGTGATLELAASDSESITFSSSTGELILDNPSTFSGQIFNFTGNGSLSGSDQIDLKDINYNSVHDSYASGVLTVTDGVDTAKLDFNGSYTLANFDFASDGHGGTIVYDPPVISEPDTVFGAQAMLGYVSNQLPDNGHGPNIALLGNYIASSFATANEGHGGGPIIAAEASQPNGQVLLSMPHHA